MRVVELLTEEVFQLLLMAKFGPLNHRASAKSKNLPSEPTLESWRYGTTCRLYLERADSFKTPLQAIPRSRAQPFRTGYSQAL